LNVRYEERLRYFADLGLAGPASLQRSEMFIALVLCETSAPEERHVSTPKKAVIELLER
jgi:hypothetical protein